MRRAFATGSGLLLVVGLLAQPVPLPNRLGFPLFRFPGFIPQPSVPVTNPPTLKLTFEPNSTNQVSFSTNLTDWSDWFQVVVGSRTNLVLEFHAVPEYTNDHAFYLKTRRLTLP